MTDITHFQDVAVDLVADLRMGRLPDNKSLEEYISSLNRASRSWKSVGYIDIATVGVLVGCYLDLVGCARFFSKEGRRMERERFYYIDRRITDQIARSLTEDCPTLHDMVRKVVGDGAAD